MSPFFVMGVKSEHKTLVYHRFSDNAITIARTSGLLKIYCCFLIFHTLIFYYMDSQSPNPDRYQTNYTTDNVYTRAGATLLSKISWGAIIAGVVVSLVTMLILNLLGVGIGLASINPVTESSPFSGVGTGAIIWWVLSNLIAIFAGGYTAARLSGVPIPTIATFHGILSWCLYTLVSFWLLTTAVGSIVSGVGSAVSQTLSAAGSVVSGGLGGSSESNQSGQQGQSSSSLNLSQITSEVKKILRQTDDPALQPGAIENKAENVAQNARQTLKEGNNLSDQEIGDLVQQVLYKGGNLVDKIDKKDVASVIAARTDMSEEAANNAADAAMRNLNEAQQQLKQLQTEATQQAEEAAAKAADVASSAAIWSFVGLLLGAIVAAVSGRAGQPKNDFVATEKEEVVHS